MPQGTWMVGKKGYIQLTIPAADAIANPATITKPQLLKKWVEDLPYANPVGTASALLDGLKLLNRHPKKIPQRAELLDIFLEPVTNIFSMARKFNSQRAGNGTRSRSTAEVVALGEKIAVEMAFGFKHVIMQEEQSRKTNQLHDKALHIYQAIYYLSYYLLFEMTTYRPDPRSVWREMFQLLLRAEQIGVHTAVLSIPLPEIDVDMSIWKALKRILLLSILDTSRLQPEEIWSAYDYFAWHASQVQLVKLTNLASQPGRFQIDRNGLNNPKLLDSENLPADQDEHLILDTHKPNHQVHNHLETLTADEHTQINGIESLDIHNKKHLLRQMLYIMHSSPKRRHPRKEQYDKLICACGIGSIRYYLEKGTLSEDEPQYQSDQDIELDSSLELNGPFSTQFLNVYNTYKWRQVDVSISGIGMITSESDIKALQIGQLILSGSEVNGTRKRWNLDASKLEVGLQFVPGRISAVTVLPEIFGQEQTTDLQPGLLIDLGETRSKAIITPNRIYHPDRQYVLEVSGGETIRIIAGRLIESSNCFDCFEYTIL